MYVPRHTCVCLCACVLCNAQAHQFVGGFDRDTAAAYEALDARYKGLVGG
jgi:hypothetical protein